MEAVLPLDLMSVAEKSGRWRRFGTISGVTIGRWICPPGMGKSWRKDKLDWIAVNRVSRIGLKRSKEFVIAFGLDDHPDH